MTDDVAAAVLAEVRALRKRGGLFEAYDRATTAMEEQGLHPVLAYEAVLCLARAGASELAHRRYMEFGLSPDMGLDYSTIIARIQKDEALLLEGEPRLRKLRDAAEAYRAAYLHFPEYYPAINAATLSLLAGDEPGAKHFAELAQSHLREQTAMSTGGSDFWGWATTAEAALILGDLATAVTAVERAMSIPDLDVSEVATTRRQLRLVITARGLDPAILDPMAPPVVAHFTGQRLTAPGRVRPAPAATEHAVREEIQVAVERHQVKMGYGSLASSLDILFAETILDAGGEVHVVLPFAAEEFVRVSATGVSEAWRHRLEALIRHPSLKVSLATFDPFLGDDETIGYAARYAMGLAVMRADMLGGSAIQLAVWDGMERVDPAGVAADVAFWRDELKRPCHVIWPPGGAGPEPLPSEDATLSPPAASVPTGERRPPGPLRRVVRALLFCDVEGFSKLSDATIPSFFAEVMGGLGRALRRHEASVLFKNTWGDAVHAVVSDAPSAASLALDLQAEMGRLDLASLGLPRGLGLRVGGHAGPVYAGWDHVLQEETFFGSQLTRCARIEPIAFTGKVFVSEAFAAELALTSSDFTCEYVGTIPTAKQFGRMPMYLLRRRR